MQASRPKTTFISAKEIKESLVAVERGSEHSCICKWEIQKYKKLKAKSVCSPIFEVGGFAFRLVIDPKGANIHDPYRHCSLLLHILNPGGLKFNCFASFKLTLVNQVNESKSFHNEFYYRFSRKNQYYGTHYSNWKEIANSEFLSSDGSLLVFVDICVLDETISFSNNDQEEPSTSTSVSSSSVFNGKFTWKIKNYSLFKEKIKTQKVFSPGFHVGNQSSLRFGFTEIEVNGVGLLQLILELKDILKSMRNDQSCWCMFKVSVLNQIQGLKHMHFDSYGRFYWDGLYECSASIKISDFIEPDKGFLVDDTVTFTVSFNAIKELMVGPVPRKFDLVMKCDLANEYVGTFKWKIDKFRRLKDHLKKKKITGLCVRSRSFQIGNEKFRLLVYPRGQSQNSSHLSMFLEVWDACNMSDDQSCFVNYRLSVVNQKNEDKSVTKESQNRSSKAMKDWGWSEFMALNSLYDQDSGYLVLDTAVFTAEVRILKENWVMQDITELSITWKIENFSSFKEITATQKIFSKSFKVGECKLRIGVYVLVDTIYAYLECDPSVVIDPDKKIWVSYRMAVVNQKDPAKTLWQKSSICTKIPTKSDLQLMKLSDMLEANDVFVVRETVIFGCVILDYHCEQEVLAEVSSQFYGLIDAKTGNIETWNKLDILKKLLVAEGCHLDEEDPHPLVTLKERFEEDFSKIAALLVTLRLRYDKPIIKYLVCLPGFSGTDVGKVDSRADESSPNLANFIEGYMFLQQIIDDLLLDIMLECCQPLKGSSGEDSYDASSEPSANTSGAVCQSESPQQIRPEELDNGFDNSTGTCAVECPDAKRSDIPNQAIFGQSDFSPETSAGIHQDFRLTGTFKTKFPESSVKILGKIVDSLKAINGVELEHHPEPGRGPQSAEKISLLLDKAPKQLLPDLITLLPKLVNHSEHPFVACALLDQFQRQDAEPALLPPILAVISQLHFGSEVWEHALSQASDFLGISNDEALEDTMRFLFKAASQCQRIPQAVKAVLERLESLGAEVSQSVLDLLSKTISSCNEVAEAMLREIDSVFALDEKCLGNLDGSSLDGENGLATKSHFVDELLLCTDRHFSNIYILIDMLAIPSLAIEASQVFERGFAHGFIVDRSVAMVLEVWFPQRTRAESVDSAENFEHKGIAGKNSSSAEEVFTLLLRHAETVSLSKDSWVNGFVKMFYSLIFRLFSHESYHNKMLERLVNHATSPSDNCCEISLDILVFLIQEEGGVARTVLGMMKKAAEHANADCTTLWDCLCAIESDIIHTQGARQAEISNIVRKKANLLEKLRESTKRYKSERSWEKEDLSKQIQAVETRFKQFLSEGDEEISKLLKEKKVYQVRLSDVETQLSHLKSQKRDELEKAVEEKNVLAERLKSEKAEGKRYAEELLKTYHTQEEKAVKEKNVLAKILKNAEAEKERFDKELKRYDTEVEAKEEERQLLLDEVQQLKQEVKQIEGEKREKEEEVAHYKENNKKLEADLHSCQQHIQSLQVSLENERCVLALLRGENAESLSMQELATLLSFHENRLLYIRALKSQKLREMRQHAPRYGGGLEYRLPSRIQEDRLREIRPLQHQLSLPSWQSSLSLNTLQNFDAPRNGEGLEYQLASRIHEDGLRDICPLQHQQGLPSRQFPWSLNTLQNFTSMHPTAPPPMADGPPTSDIPNGAQLNSNGLNHGTAAPRFYYR